MNMMGAMMAASRRRVVLLPETIALLAAMTTQPDQTRVTLINNTIKDLKDAGVWALLDSMKIYTAHDLQASLLDWITPGSRSSTLGGTGMIFHQNQWWENPGDSGNGIRTGFNGAIHGVNYTAPNASVFSLVRAGRAAGLFYIGGRNAISSANYNGMNLTSDGRIQARFHDTSVGVSSAVGFDSPDFSLVTKNRPTIALYRNGVLVGSSTRDVEGMPNFNYPVLGYHNNASTIVPWAGTCQCVGFGGHMTNQQQLDLFNILNGYFTSIGIGL
jgi:hypothetical protein